MKDPYIVLGVSRSDSDEAIKKAYRELARKYHPDNYTDNPLADLAQEKMKEINEAYEAIQRERAGGSHSRTYSDPFSGSSRSGHSSGPYADARSAINCGDLNRAEMILGSITDRGAEWNFLMGSLAYRRGWMDEASRYFRKASAMDPTNSEYRQAADYMSRSAGQPFTNGQQNNMDEVCDICGKLWMADCCCELMGGDLIPCC